MTKKLKFDLTEKELQGKSVFYSVFSFSLQRWFDFVDAVERIQQWNRN